MAIMQRIRTVFTGVAGTPWYNNLYFDETGGSPNDRCVAVDAFWNTLTAVMSSDVDYEVSADVAFIEDSTGEIVEVRSDTAYNGSGIASDSMLPPANQGLIRLKTGFYVNGRQITGRVFVPAFTEAGCSEGQPIAAAIASMQSAADALLSEEPSWRVFSPTKLTSATITNVSVWNQFAVLRSRRD